jgi:hypothetical protein
LSTDLRIGLCKEENLEFLALLLQVLHDAAQAVHTQGDEFTTVTENLKKPSGYGSRWSLRCARYLSSTVVLRGYISTF